MSYQQIPHAVTDTTRGLTNLRDAIAFTEGTLSRGNELKYGEEKVADILTKIDKVCAWLQRLQEAAAQREQRMNEAHDVL